MTQSKPTFIWKLPSLSDNQMGTLCTGYIRNEFPKYIPKDIIELCTFFYKNNAKSNALNKSSTFEYKNIKFYMSFERTKYKDNPLLKKLSEWTVHIPYYPQHIHRIDIECQHIISYTDPTTNVNTIHNNTTKQHHFELDPNKADERTLLKMASSFDSSDINPNAILSFHIIFDEVKLYDSNLNEKPIQDTHNELKTDRVEYIDNVFRSNGGHRWMLDEHTLFNLKRAIPGTYFISNIFNISQFKFLMKLSYYDDVSYGSATDFCLYLTSLSHRIKELHIRYKVWITDVNVLIDECYSFKTNIRSLWKLDLFHANDIKHLNVIRLNIEIMILDIFYQHKDNAHKYEIAIYPSLSTLQGGFEWTISDIDTMDRIKSAATGMDFCSGMYALGAFKWYLKFYPNGYSSNYSGSTDLFLRLASLPPNIAHISCAYHLILLEKNATHFTVSQFSTRSSSFGWNKLKNTDIIDLNTFTFIAKINIIDVYDGDGHMVTQQYIDDCEEKHDMELVSLEGDASCHFMWKIEGDALSRVKGAHNGDQFESELFMISGLLWMIKLYPNGDSLDDEGNGETLIHLASLSPSFSKICIFYKITLMELGVSKNSSVGLTHSRMKCWTENMWKLADIDELKTVTFRLEIGILDIFNEKGRCINDEYDAMLRSNRVVNLEKHLDCKYRKVFKWEIRDAVKVKQIKESQQTVSFKSGYYRLYSAALFMQFNPNHEEKQVGQEHKEEDKDTYCSFGFTLCSIPPSIHSLSLRFVLNLSETHTEYMNVDQFSNEYNIVNWNIAHLYKSEIMDLVTFTFGVIIDIVAAYDKEGNDVTLDFIANDADSKQEIQVNCVEYEWMVDDCGVISDIRSATTGQHFMSPIFCVFNLKWFLQFIPNPVRKDGNKECNNEGTSLFICLASLSPVIGYISMHYELRLTIN